MKKYLTVFSSFIIMLCIGSVYAWSLVAAELIEKYSFSASQSQIIFGTLIALFPVTMIMAGHLSKRVPYRYFGYTAGLLFAAGYSLAGFSQGRFIIVFLGIGVLGGVATGFGYWTALTAPVLWFPDKKGLVTGIAAAGFGLGAVMMAEISEVLLNKGFTVFQILKIIGIAYGLVISFLSNFIFKIDTQVTKVGKKVKISVLIGTANFKKLFFGIFLGTFAGLLVIGSLRFLGSQHGITDHILVLGVAVFSLANFMGRLAWGGLSDQWGAGFCIFLALLIQSLAILSLNAVLSGFSFLLLSALIGFNFGGNFVLFARETAHLYGVANLGMVYPYVFMGYAIAGITGPVSGGLLYDLTGSFFYSVILASLMSVTGSFIFFYESFLSKCKLSSRKRKNTVNVK